MIWIVGGTSDTISLLNLLKNKMDFSKLIVSVTTDYGKKLLDFEDLKIFKGKIEQKEIMNFINLHNIHTIIDTSHPYAENISKNILDEIDLEKIKYLRYERPQSKTEAVLNFGNIDQMINYINTNLKNERILSTLGSKAIPKLSEIETNEIYLRILPSVESLKSAFEFGFLPKQIIAIQGPFSKEFEKEMMKFYGITCILTKNSGEVGGFSEKIEVSKNLGVKCLVLDRPQINYPNTYNNLEIISNIIL